MLASAAHFFDIAPFQIYYGRGVMRAPTYDLVISLRLLSRRSYRTIFYNAAKCVAE